MSAEQQNPECGDLSPLLLPGDLSLGMSRQLIRNFRFFPQTTASVSIWEPFLHHFPHFYLAHTLQINDLRSQIAPLTTHPAPSVRPASRPSQGCSQTRKCGQSNLVRAGQTKIFSWPSGLQKLVPVDAGIYHACEAGPCAGRKKVRSSPLGISPAGEGQPIE